MGKTTTPLEPTPVFEFDFESDMKENGFIVVFGTRGRGKTTLTRIFTQLMPWSFTAQFVFFVGTEQVKEQWSAVSHPFYVRNPEPGALQELLDIQREKIQLCKYYNIPFPKEWELVIVTDDCGSFVNFLRDKVVRTIAANGRNEHITFVALIQDWVHLDPTARGNATTFIGMRTEHLDIVKTIHKNYASSINKDRFEAVYSTVTSGNKALCINCGADDPRELLGVTHARLLHPDGHEAIANQQEADLINQKRVEKGKPERTWNVHNMLKRLGAKIHQDIAMAEYRTPSLKELVKSNSLLKMMTKNSISKALSSSSPPPTEQKPQRRRSTSKSRASAELTRRPSLLDLAMKQDMTSNQEQTQPVSEEDKSDASDCDDDESDADEDDAASYGHLSGCPEITFQSRNERQRFKLSQQRKPTKKTSKKKNS